MRAAEAWCFLRNLPLIIGTKVPLHNEEWQLLLMLLDCMDIIFAPVLTPGLADLLAYIIQDHHSYFKTLYPSKNLLPKHHFLTHYPEFIKKFGPLSQYWCMRFEEKHQFGKELASTVHNFRNICKTIAERTQMELAYSLLTDNLFTSAHVVTSCSSVLLSTLESDMVTCIRRNISLCSNDEVSVVHSVIIGHYYWQPGCCGVLKCEDGQPTFGEIVMMIAVDKDIHFIFEEFNTTDYVEHFHAYCIEYSGVLVVHQSTDLKDHLPLSVHKVTHGGQELSLIAPRYKIV